MNFVHAFWSKPLYNKKFTSFEEALANTLLDYAYSVSCVHKFGHTITLYADKDGIELLKNIPYDDVVEITDIDSESFHFAASIKFYALRQMKLNDILIDGDIFLENENIFKVLKNSKADITYSFYESKEYVVMVGSTKDNNYFGRLIDNCNKCNELMFDLPEKGELEYPNTSLIKITNQKLKESWIDSYFWHRDHMKDIDFEDTWPDMIIKQYMLDMLIIENNYKQKEIIVDYMNNQNSQYVKNLGFTHLGGMKTQMMSKVRQKLYFSDIGLLKKLLEQYKEITGKDL